jgi:hypothetical protein
LAACVASYARARSLYAATDCATGSLPARSLTSSTLPHGESAARTISLGQCPPPVTDPDRHKHLGLTISTTDGPRRLTGLDD